MSEFYESLPARLRDSAFGEAHLLRLRELQDLTAQSGPSDFVTVEPSGEWWYGARKQ